MITCVDLPITTQCTSKQVPPHTFIKWIPSLNIIGLSQNKGARQNLTESPYKKTTDFSTSLQMHRSTTQQVVAKAQESQKKWCNKSQHPTLEKAGNRVLVNPHSPEWIRSKGNGSKIHQQWIGPFEITQRAEIKSPKVRSLNGVSYPMKGLQPVTWHMGSSGCIEEHTWDPQST